jgi:hypothetical protein
MFMQHSWLAVVGVTLFAGLAPVSRTVAVEVPLPTWILNTTGNGSASMTTNGVISVSINLTTFSGGGATAAATSASDVLVTTSNTTYTLRALAKVNGPGSGQIGLLLNGTSTASILVPTTGINVAPTNYSTSFTTGGPSDPRVGLPLKAQVLASSGPQAGGMATYTEIALLVETSNSVPSLTIRHVSPSELQIAWSTNFPNYSAQTADGAITASWVPLTNTPVIVDSQYVISILPTSTQQYFRLQQ